MNFIRHYVLILCLVICFPICIISQNAIETEFSPGDIPCTENHLSPVEIKSCLGEMDESQLNSILESLEAQSSQIPQDNFVQARIYYLLDSPQKGIEFGEDKIINFKEDQPLLLAAFLENLGECYYEKQQYFKAYVPLLESRSILHEAKTDSLTWATVSYNLALVYKKIGNYDLSNEILYSITDYYSTTKDSLMLSACYSVISSNHGKSKNNTLAEDYQNRALKIREKLKNNRGIAASYFNLGRVKIQQEDYNEATRLLEKSRELWSDLNLPLKVAKSYSNLGVVEYKKQNFNLAQEYYEKSIELKLLHGDSTLCIAVFNDLSEVHLKNKRFTDAIEIAKKSSLLSSRNGDLEQTLFSHKLLAEGYEGIGDYRNSNKYFQKYTTLLESFNEIEKLKSFQANEVKYQTAQREKELAFLQSDNAIQENNLRFEKERSVVLRKFNIVLILSLLAMLTLAIFLFRARKRIAFLMKEFKHRMSNNLQMLHDTVSLEVHASEEGEVKTKLAEVEGRIKAMNRLNSQLDIKGNYIVQDLGKYLEGFCKSLAFTHGKNREVVFTSEGKISVDQKDGNLLGLITNEMFTNALKYGQGEIKIDLEIENNKKHLSIHNVKAPKEFKEREGMPGGEGSNLMLLLVQQLGGELNVVDEKNTYTANLTWK